MRIITNPEIHLPVRLQGILDNTNLVYVDVDGNFTTILIFARHLDEHTGCLPIIGTAKRNPIDEPNALRGIRVAMAKAVKRLKAAE